MESRERAGAFCSSAEALFRHQVVSLVKSWMLSGEPKAVAVQRAASMMHPTFSGEPRRVSRRTVYRWLAVFEAKGTSGLEPSAREQGPPSEVLSEELLDFISRQKADDLAASLPELLRRARLQKVVTAGERIDRTTVWRACQRAGIPVRRRKQSKDRDTRRFAYPHRMEMVLSDGKHFRAGIRRAKRVALFYLDDCTRYGLHVVVGTSENKKLFLRGLYELVRLVGLMLVLYLDRGPGFRALDTAEVVNKLDALLIHGEKAYPSGHGKVEKFNQTAKNDVLRGLDRRPDVDPSCSALELRLQHYLREVYNHSPHESLDGQTPYQRFHADKKPLRFPEDDADLRRRFVVHEKRLVSNDHVISVDSVDYEVPRGLAGETVILHRRVLDDSLVLPHQGRLVELKPVDLAKNARSQRARSEQQPKQDEETGRPLPRSAADMLYERDLCPVVDADGGFTETRDPDPEEDER